MVMDIFWKNGLSESDFSFLWAITLGKLSSVSTIAKCGSNRIQGKESLLRDWQALSSGPSCDLHVPCGASPRSLWESSEITPEKLLAKKETERARIRTQIFLRPKLLFRNSQKLSGSPRSCSMIVILLSGPFSNQAFSLLWCPSLGPGPLVRLSDSGQVGKLCTCLVLLVNFSVKF